MRKALTILLVFLVVLNIQPVPAAGNEAESSYDHIMRTGTIRCAYLLYTPYFVRDVSTGEMSGVFHDIMEEIGKSIGLKVEWVMEVGYDNIFPGLDSGQYDVFAGGLWPNSKRARAGYFTLPAFYSVVTAWGRKDETRFKNLEGINDPFVRVSTVDGAIADVIAQTDYPKATIVSLPNLTPYSMTFQNIIDNKADITFVDASVAQDFLRTHPGAIQQIAPDKPLRVFGNSLVVRRGNIDLKLLLDTAMQELVYSGRIDKILQKYEKQPSPFKRLIQPYFSSPQVKN
ncbi:MAG: transporter substrate-binding domain-containing protein [Alphaproteobacteria bacterium]|nr:transporter substrate-binding domain-containing protein [Alphaproteobacteria bacterium]